MKSCNGCSYVSFPLRLAIQPNELKSSYDKLKECFSFLISSQIFKPRFTNPTFEDEARLSGRIDEDINSLTMIVNGITYNLESVQITYPTHSDWIPNSDLSKPIQNKIDIVITLYNIQERDPKYILYIIPLIVDSSVTNDNSYLQGIAYLNQAQSYSIETIFKSIPSSDYVTYQTCVGQGDNIYVCFNYTGIKISTNLYNSMLALWTNQDLSSIQKQIQDQVKKAKKQVQETLNNIRVSLTNTDLVAEVNSLAGQLQIQKVINSSVDVWPVYVAPFINQNTLPSTLVKEIKCTSFQENCVSSNIEGFANMEGFITGPFVPAPDPPPAPAPISSAISNIKCISLDLDGAITSDNKINFDAEGHVMLSDIQSQRDSLRNSSQVSKVNFEQLRIIGGVGIAIMFVLLIMYFLINFFLGGLLPENMKINMSGMGFYAIMGGIFSFAGFLIGAALVK